MANNILVVAGTDIVLASGSYSPGASANNNFGTATDTLDLTSVAAGAAEQSNIIDLTATRAALYNVMSAIEFDIAPTAGGTVDLYWAPQNNATAGKGAPGEVAGVSGAYTGTTADTLANSLKQLMYIGSHVVTVDDDADAVQVAVVGTFAPPQRYGTLVVVNNADQSTIADSVEQAVLMSPIIDQVQ